MDQQSSPFKMNFSNSAPIMNSNNNTKDNYSLFEAPNNNLKNL